MNRVIRLLALISISILLSACQANVRTLIAFSDSGSGDISITASVDEELAQLVAQTSSDPLANAYERAQSLGNGWKATKNTFESGQTQSITLAAPFTTADELTQRVKQIEEGLHTNGLRMIGSFTVAEGEDTFTIDVNIPFEVTDETAQALGFANAASALEAYPNAITNEVVVRSSTKLVSANIPTTPVDPKDPEGPQEIVMRLNPGQVGQAQVTYAKGGRNWLILIGGALLAALLFGWGMVILNRAKKLAHYQQQQGRSRPGRPRT